MSLPRTLVRALDGIATAPSLVVGSDVDGTLAPLAPDPASARVLPGAVDLLAALAALDSTTVVVVSGRSLRELHVLLPGALGVVLVGSHGAEVAGGPAPLDEEQEALRARLVHEALRLARGRAGVRVERKPVGVAVHVRLAPRAVAAQVLGEMRSGMAAWPGVHVLEGKEVLELAVLPVDKGAAFQRVLDAHPGAPALFLGDDATDEHVFERARTGDVTVKVGDGETSAGFRVGAPPDVLDVLRLVLSARASRAGA